MSLNTKVVVSSRSLSKINLNMSNPFDELIDDKVPYPIVAPMDLG